MDQYIKTSFTQKEMLKLIDNLKLDFEPGTRHQYSSFGYLLLGFVLEKITGMTYSKLLNDHIFTPLGMTSSSCPSNVQILRKMAAPYTFAWTRNSDGKASIGFENASFRDATTTYSTGGIFATVNDMLKWNNGLLGNSLLPDSLTNLLFKEYSSALDPSNGYGAYGYGWMLDKNFRIDDEKPISYNIKMHTGGGSGYTATNTIINNGEVIIVTLENQDITSGPFLTRNILRIYNGLPTKPVRENAVLPIAQRLIKNDYNGAIEIYDRAKRQPQTYSVHLENFLQASDKLLNISEATHAIQLLNLGIQLYPESAELEYKLAEVYSRKEIDKVKSKKAYQKAIDLWRKEPNTEEKIKDAKEKLDKM